MNNRLKKFLLPIGVVIISLFISLISGELMMRLLLTPQPIPTPPLPGTIDPYRPNPYIVRARPYFYFHIPNASYTQARAGYKVQYTINARGFRGPEHAASAEEGRKRLVVIGDSVAEGHGNEFEQAFPALLNEHLQSSGWEVVNAGVQGASPIYYATNAERYLALQPNAVLLLLYENDLREDRVREMNYFKLPYLDDAENILQPSLTHSPPRSHLLLAVTRLRRKLFLSPLEQLIADNKKQTEQNREYWPSPKADPFLIAPASLKECWQLSQSYLDYLTDIFEQRGTQLLVANLSIHAVRPESKSRRQDYARTLDGYASVWAKRRKLPFLSLLPVIRQAFQEKAAAEVIIKGDGHPTAETHVRIEAALRPWLLQNLISRADAPQQIVISRQKKRCPLP